MIRINLLPYRAAKKKENIRRQVSIYLLSIVVVMLLAYAYNASLKSKVVRITADITATKAQVVKYKKINQEIAEIKKKLELLNRKIEVIQSLERDRKVPVQTMDDLYRLLVQKRMWYTKIEDRVQTIKVNGIAIDNQTVADFMTRVEKTDTYQNVRLAAIKQQKLQGQDLRLKQFEVNFSRNMQADPANPAQKNQKKPRGAKQ
jgi:type IV pilus assembly protein PilN